MKNESILIAERPLARHSELLATRPPETGALVKALSECTSRLASALADELAELIGSARPAVTIDKVEKAPAAKVHKVIPPVAANFQFASTGGAQVLASLDYHSALVLTDQMFGGRGDWAGVSPEKLPPSANMTLDRMIGGIGNALTTTFSLGEPMAIRARSDVLGKLITMRDAETFLTLRVAIALNDAKPWHIMLVLRQGHAALLLDETASAATATSTGDRRRPDAKPFANIPLSLTAVLARLNLPVSRISAMQPGDTIPLAIGRNVALRLADTEIARGEVGASDGALALRLTSVAWNSKGQDQ